MITDVFSGLEESKYWATFYFIFILILDSVLLDVTVENNWIYYYKHKIFSCIYCTYL